MSKVFHTCTRCRDNIADDKLELPDRCVDRNCPLNEMVRQRKRERAERDARPEKSKLENIWNGG